MLISDHYYYHISGNINSTLCVDWKTTEDEYARILAVVKDAGISQFELDAAKRVVAKGQAMAERFPEMQGLSSAELAAIMSGEADLDELAEREGLEDGFDPWYVNNHARLTLIGRNFEATARRMRGDMERVREEQDKWADMKADVHDFWHGLFSYFAF